MNIPAEAIIPAVVEGQTLKVFHNEKGWFQSEERPNVFVDEHKLDYVVGSGANGMSFLVRRGDGLFQAPLSFYSKTAKWNLSPGYEHLDLGFGRTIAEQCVVCHSGRARPVENRKGDYRDPAFQELAVGCENCHGPGEAHTNNPKLKTSIVNPAKLSPRLAEEICMNCHQRGDARVLQPGKTLLDFRPGQWLFETLAVFKIPPAPEDSKEADLLEHNSSMKASLCFRASKGQLSCLTCHDPHIEPSSTTAVEYFRTKCFTCHNDKSCSLGIQQRLMQSPPDNCIGCHMPERNVSGIAHSALTNHRIPARAGEPMPAAEMGFEIGGLVLVNGPDGHLPAVPDSTLLRAYSELASRNARYGDLYLRLLNQMAARETSNPLVQAGLGHKALAEGDNEGALEHLTAAIPLREPAVLVDMAKALSGLGRESEALSYLKQAINLDPYDFTILKMTILAEIKEKNYPEARETMQRYVTLLPEDPFMRDLLARVSH